MASTQIRSETPNMPQAARDSPRPGRDYRGQRLKAAMADNPVNSPSEARAAADDGHPGAVSTEFIRRRLSTAGSTPGGRKGP